MSSATMRKGFLSNGSEMDGVDHCVKTRRVAESLLARCDGEEDMRVCVGREEDIFMKNFDCVIVSVEAPIVRALSKTNLWCDV